MMVVLLVMTIILAAMAPVITTRMSANKAVGGNSKSEIWKYVEDSGETDIYYGTTNNQRAMIGQNKAETVENARLILNTSDDIPNHLIFRKGDKTLGALNFSANDLILLGSIKADSIMKYSQIAIGKNVKILSSGDIVIGNGSSITGSTSTNYSAIAIGAPAYSKGNSVAIGYGARISGEYGDGSVAIGKQSSADDNAVSIRGSSKNYGVNIGGSSGKSGVAIGYGASSSSLSDENSDAIAIGASAKAYADNAIAIGAAVHEPTLSNPQTEATGESSIAIGSRTKAKAEQSVAIGRAAEATAINSIAIGSDFGNYNTEASGEASIAIGTEANASGKQSIALGYKAKATTANTIVLGTAKETVQIPGSLTVATTSYPSDKKLKNIGKEYTSSLDKIKQLKPFNFIYKDDKNKIPRVGVIAQDLQKVFPNAVSKGKDGFLTIRMEDMFYAVINAIKELDAKITQMMKQESEKDKKIKDLEKRIEFLEQKLMQSP